MSYLPGPQQAGASARDAFQIVVYSANFMRIGVLSAGRGDGSVIETELTFEKYGGLKSFVVSMRATYRIPITPDSIFVFYYGKTVGENPVAGGDVVLREALGVGYVTDVPPRDTTGGMIQIAGVGYSQKLKSIKVTKTVSGQTIAEVIADFDGAEFSDLFVVYNAAKVNPPAVTITSIEWADRDLWSCMMDLLTIANNAFGTEEYCFGVDAAGEFYFQPMAKDTTHDQLFEGYQYQAPVVEYSRENMVNRIVLFRATNADPKVTEYVDTYEDTDSITAYGAQEKKIVFPSYVDTTTAGKFADGILTNYKDVKKKIRVSNLVIRGPVVLLPWKHYGVATRQTDQAIVLSECNTLDDWSKSITNSTLALLAISGVSSRAALGWEKGASSTDYIELTFDPIFSPRELRFFSIGWKVQFRVSLIDFDLSPESIDTLVDSNGDTIVGDISGTPAGVKTITTYSPSTSPVSDGVYNYTYPTGTVGDTQAWKENRIDLSNVLRLGKIRVTLTGSSDPNPGGNLLLLDRFEVYAKSYQARRLPLEKAVYLVTRDRVIIDTADFGGVPVALTDEIGIIGASASTYADVTAKQ